MITYTMLNITAISERIMIRSAEGSYTTMAHSPAQIPVSVAVLSVLKSRMVDAM